MTYLKAKVEQKRKLNKEYQEKLFTTSSLVLPAVVARLPDDATPGEMVDMAVLIARDLLAELGYKEIGDTDETERG